MTHLAALHDPIWQKFHIIYVMNIKNLQQSPKIPLIPQDIQNQNVRENYRFLKQKNHVWKATEIITSTRFDLLRLVQGYLTLV